MSKAANICGLLSAVGFGWAPVRQIFARLDYWRLERFANADTSKQDRLARAAERFTMRDGIRFSLPDTLATAIGVVLLAAAFTLELIGA